MQKIYTFHVNGMHCASCIILTESELQEVQGVTRVKSSLATHSTEVTGDFGEKEPEAIAAELSKVLIPHGYSLSVEKKAKIVEWSEFKIAIPIALAFGALFILLQKVGLVNLVNTDSLSYGAAFVVGIIASLSTCMAVVGGLVLSMSATFAKEGDRVKPQLMFHGSRLAAFFVLGGVIGAIGSAFVLGTTATFIMGLGIAIVMLILGINLLDVFHGTKRLAPAMPKVLAKHAWGVSKINHTLTPVLVGIATFFLPCGFTQSMQFYTLSAGSFMNGALIMLAFALGTLPVLAAISFSSFSIQKSQKSGIFFKTAGLVVIMFALLNLVNSLVVIGLIPPVFNF